MRIGVSDRSEQASRRGRQERPGALDDTFWGTSCLDVTPVLNPLGVFDDCLPPFHSRTAINVATLLWLWRSYKGEVRSALTVADGDLEVVAGARLRCRIPRGAVANVESTTWRSVPDISQGFVHAAKPMEPNVMLVLREPTEVQLPLGVTKRVTRIGLKVREVDAVLEALSSLVGTPPRHPELPCHPERSEGSARPCWWPDRLR